jgi:thiol-disulfide isomerase/thioredoxin
MAIQKIIFACISALLFSFSVVAGIGSKPVEIKGTLLNCKDEKLFIETQNFKDSVTIDSKGKFAFKTIKIPGPIQAYVNIGNRISLTTYLAPGYNIIINANAENTGSFYNSLLITGVGSKTNQYWKAYHFLYKNQLNPGSDMWYDIKSEYFIKERLCKPNLDSFRLAIHKTIFNDRNQEPYKDFFEEAADINIRFRKLFWLFQYFAWNDFTIGKRDSLINESIDQELFANLSLDNYLFIDVYRQTIGFLYLEYLFEKELAANKEMLVSKLKRKLELSDSLYHGKTRDHVFNTLITSGIGETFSSQEMAMMRSYIGKIKDKTLRSELFKKWHNRKSIVDKLTLGKEAPVFNLPDSDGRRHSLNDFKGKVVFIDLWASWCGPCKVAMPALKEIYEEYKPSGKLIIISIAVHDEDGKEKRNAFINKLQLNWLHLEDQDNFVWTKYKITSIPRFILIDKEGKIISFDAPEPAAKETLKKLLDEALSN